MKLTLKIDMDNAAFEPESGTEAARILKKLASALNGELLTTDVEVHLFDLNGNHVGKAKVTR